MQGVDLRAAVGIFVSINMDSALCVNCIVPSETFTSGFIESLMNRVVDGEVNHDNRITIANGLKSLRVSTCGRVNAVIPDEAFAYHRVKGGCDGMIENEMEGVGTWTTVIVDVAEWVGPRLLIVDVMPSVAVTAGDGFHIMSTVING